MSTGSRIAELRTQRGWSRTRLAKEINSNTTSVKKWELELSQPRSDAIVALAKVFGVSSDYLLSLDDRPLIYTDGIPQENCRMMEDLAQFLRNRSEKDKPENKQKKQNP